MSYLNAVIEQVDAGHVASYSGKDAHEPIDCKRCGERWPCAVIRAARAAVRRLHGVKSQEAA